MSGGGVEHVVVLRALGLGDLLTGVPALRAIRSAYPSARMTLAGPAALAPLAHASGAVDGVVDVRGLDTPLPGALHGADVAVNLHGSGPQSHRLLLDTAPGRLVAFGCAAAGIAGPDWRADEHEVLRWCRLLSECGIPADPAALDIDLPVYGVPVQLHGCTVVHPGAAFRARQWPADRWAEVAGAELAAGRTVLVTGSAAEADLVRAVVDATSGPAPAAAARSRPTVETLVGADIRTFAAHIAAAGRVLCADTGVAHLATALRRPSVVLFGPTPPELWGPPADRREHVVIWKGRTGDPLADEPDPGLLEIAVPEVVAAAGALG